MQNALAKPTVIVFLIGMLLVSCATTSSTSTSEEMAAAAPASEPAVAQPMTPEDQEARRKYEIERNRFMYEDIFFDKNGHQLNAQARDLLDWKAGWLQAHPQLKIRIEGHCGKGGRAEDNMALGLRRAGEVKGYLLKKGIARDRLSAISYGSERPLALGEGEEVQAKNRRVRLVILDN